jgi:hypothetical protein
MGIIEVIMVLGSLLRGGSWFRRLLFFGFHLGRSLHHNGNDFLTCLIEPVIKLFIGDTLM